MNRLSRVLSPGRGIALTLLLAAGFVAGCGRSLDDDPNSPVSVTVEQTYLTIANKAGSALVDGTIELVPAGVLAPYRTSLPRVESGSSREIRYELFSGAGGARFVRGGTRIRSVRVVAVDNTGKTHKREVPFN